MVANHIDGDLACVLVMTPEWGGYLYMATCVRHDDGWHDASGSDAPSILWLSDDGETDVETGTMYLSGDDADDFDAATITVGDHMVEVPAQHGHYACVLREVPNELYPQVEFKHSRPA